MNHSCDAIWADLKHKHLRGKEKCKWAWGSGTQSSQGVPLPKSDLNMSEHVAIIRLIST